MGWLLALPREAPAALALAEVLACLVALVLLEPARREAERSESSKGRRRQR